MVLLQSLLYLSSIFYNDHTVPRPSHLRALEILLSVSEHVELEVTYCVQVVFALAYW